MKAFFQKLLQSKIVKIWSAISVGVVFIAFGLFAVFRYVKTTTYTISVLNDRSIEVKFDHFKLWRYRTVSSNPEYPVEAWCDTLGLKLGKSSYCFTKRIELFASVPFIPGQEYMLGIPGVGSFNITPIQTASFASKAIPFVTSNPRIYDEFVFENVSDTTKIAVSTNPELKLKYTKNDQELVVEPLVDYKPRTSYDYVATAWEESEVTKKEAELLQMFCKERTCKFEISIDPPRIKTKKTILAEGAFDVPNPLSLAEMTPEKDETNVFVDMPITIAFAKEIDESSIDLAFESKWKNKVDIQLQQDGKTIKITPKAKKGWEYDTDYLFTLGDNLRGTDGSRLYSPIEASFRTIGSVKILDSEPDNGQSKVSLSSNIEVTFDQEVDKDSAEAAFSISPDVSGSFSWSGNTMIFDPSGFDLLEKYTVTIDDGIKSIHGLPSEDSREFSFTTTHKQTYCIGYSVDGRGIYASYFGSGSKTVVYTSGLHGSERSSVYVTDQWEEYLEDHPEILPSDTRAIVVTIGNPDAYAYEQRFNTNGVDINRNWGTASWQQGVYFRDQYYPNAGGSKPFSEPETRALRDLLNNSGADILIDVHCCAAGVWGGETSGRSAELASMLRSEFGYSSGSGGWSDYSVTGSMTTWGAENKGIPSATVEVYSGASFSRHQEGLIKVLSF